MRSVLRLFTVLILSAFPAVAIGSPAPVDPAVYGQLPSIDSIRVSPSGQRVAYVIVKGGQRQLMVRNLAGAPVYVGNLGVQKVRNVDWAGDGHVLLTTSATGYLPVFTDSDEYVQVVSINLTTRKVVAAFAKSDRVFHAVYGFHGVFERNGRWFGYFGGVTLNKTRGFEPSFNSSNYVDLYSVDLDDGVETLVAQAHQKYRRWVQNSAGVVVARSEYVVKTGEWKLASGVSDGAVLTTATSPLNEINLVGMGRTADTVLVDSENPEEWTLSSGEHKALSLDKDIYNYLFDPATALLAGVALAGDRHEQVFFNPVLKARQASFRKALGGDPIIVSWSADAQQMILYTEGDHDAGTYWLVNGAEVKPYAYRYPNLEDANVGAVRAITYKAGDGTEIHGILTLPPQKDARNLPLIVLPHSELEEHDFQTFDWWAQAFAGRGYAVFQPNFRGSSGYGLGFRNAGFGQLGRKMQTDISDGVAELARQGIADPKRVCIVGGHYGGYAALAAVTVQGGLYRCAVSYGAVSDLSTYMYWLSPSGDVSRGPGMRFINSYLGARKLDDPLLKSLSPSAQAAKATAPVLLIHGADDTIVPISQSRIMEHALKAAGKPVEFVELKGEDHWLSLGPTRTEMLTAAIGFVERNNPPN